MALILLYCAIEWAIIIGAGTLLYKWLFPKIHLILIESYLLAQEIYGSLLP